MLSRDFRLAFGRNSSSFPLFPRSAGDDGRYSTATISVRALPCWFFSLAWKSPRLDVRKRMSKVNSGNPQAQFKLGVAYDRGVGVDRSEYEAM